MKPSWENAPEWANWLAMDRDGEWVWFENCPWPSRGDGLWVPVDDGNYKPSDQDTAPPPVDWLKSIECRP